MNASPSKRRLLQRHCASLMLGVLALALTTLQACGGGADRTKAHVRLVNASADYPSLSLTIDGSTLTPAAAYGDSPDYADATRGTQNLDVYSAGSAAVQKSVTAGLGKDGYYSLVAYGKAGSLATVLLDDSTATPASDKALLRILNAAPDAGNVDVYLTDAGDPLTTATPLQSGVAYGALGITITINSGTWRLRVTGASQKDDLRLDVSGLVFDGSSVKTLVLTPGRGGALVNALVLGQQAGIARVDNTQARVRVVAGVSDRGVVQASVAGLPLLNGVAAPATVGYTLFDAGEVTATVTANGAPAPLATTTLAGGGDYSLLVYGTPAAPVAVWVSDDNRLPADAAKAKLRLVHGVANVTGTLALKLDLAVSASGVPAGGASSYSLAGATTAARLEISSSDSSLAPYTTIDRTLIANSVYSLFMLGSAAAPVDALVKDR